MARGFQSHGQKGLDFDLTWDAAAAAPDDDDDDDDDDDYDYDLWICGFALKTG